MFYDHSHIIHLFKGLSSALDTALDFIAAAQLPMDNESTLLAHAVKAIVSEYTTKETNSKGYEAHIKYVDEQFLLAGSEVIQCCPLEFLTPTTEYDESSDCRFYDTQPGSGFALRLGVGYFAVLFPDNGHLPGLALGESGAVKKVVVKVPMR